MGRTPVIDSTGHLARTIEPALSITGVLSRIVFVLSKRVHHR